MTGNIVQLPNPRSRTPAVLALVLAVAGLALSTVVTIALASLIETEDLYTPAIGVLQQIVFFVGVAAVAASVVLAGIALLNPRFGGRAAGVAALVIVSLGVAAALGIAVVGVATSAG
ncbi:hypothetical protein P0L94_01005 [Microbacter sp. GSS18]|nr:hypothetical protein P0L94_01005 [Microbacter sp. GSS18]